MVKFSQICHTVVNSRTTEQCELCSTALERNAITYLLTFRLNQLCSLPRRTSALICGRRKCATEASIARWTGARIGYMFTLVSSVTYTRQSGKGHDVLKEISIFFCQFRQMSSSQNQVSAKHRFISSTSHKTQFLIVFNHASHQFLITSSE